MCTVESPQSAEHDIFDSAHSLDTYIALKSCSSQTINTKSALSFDALCGIENYWTDPEKPDGQVYIGKLFFIYRKVQPVGHHNKNIY